MSINHSSEKANLRDIKVPEDYCRLAELFNLIEPGSTTVEALKEEDSHIPVQTNLKLDDNGLLVGYGRTRVVVETADGQIVGYGACFRAPWTDPGTVGSTFCVHPDFRSQGIGEMILAYIEEWAKKQQASVMTSMVMDWIDGSLTFVEKRGLKLDAHVFELELNLAQFDAAKYEQVIDDEIKFTTLAELHNDEAVKKLYDLFVETSKDNPGQYGSVEPFVEWKKEFLPENLYRYDWIYIAVDGDEFAGFTQLLKTDVEGVLYTNYTGVKAKYRHKGIAKALKLLAIKAALAEGANTITTDSEETNEPMQHINRSFGFVPGQGHYRVVKQLKETN